MVLDMNDLVLWHNPRCSKSRETLALLREHGVEPRIVEYLKTPPDAGELSHVLDLLGIEPRDLMRHKEAPYQALGLDNPTLDRDTLIAAMVANPVLIERPVAIRGNRAAIGRPPERVLDLLPD